MAAMSHSTGYHGVTYYERLRSNHIDCYYQVTLRDPNGLRKTVAFFVGTENTWTKTRDRRQLMAAKRLRRGYERYLRGSGPHPLAG